MLFTTTVLAALVATVAAKDKSKRTFAVLQFTDGPLMDCRMDPIVQPGGPSAHVHTFMGANNVGFNTNGEDLRKSTCTNALPLADLSSYWVPKMYFKDPSTGQLEAVPFFYQNVYYFFDASNDDIKAFPLGLKLVSGNALARSTTAKNGAVNLDPSKGPVTPAAITCPRSNFNPPSWPAGSDGSMAGLGNPNNKGEGFGFPFQDCDGYASPMRVDVHFPSCYNPAAGLDNFKANSAFPSDAGNGKLDCPQGWIHVPHMFFETYWDTHKFLPRFQNLIGKESPFVFANGDVTGYSAHGDFISGWDERALQQIIDNCDVGHQGLHSCPGLIGGVNSRGTSCKATCPVTEDVKGPFDKLPGNNPLAGWKYGAETPEAPSNDYPPVNLPVVSSATPSKPAAAEPEVTAPAGGYGTTTVVNTVTVYQTKTVYGSGPTPTKATDGKDIGEFKPVGCFKDSSDRFLAGEKFANIGKASNTKCVEHCASKSFSIAGTQYGGECFCGNSLTTVEELDESKCDMSCDGDDSQICGGKWALTIFTKDGVAPSSSPKKRHVHDHFMHHRRGHSHQ
ncbi:hypothetical protein B0T16DRAFT_375131 [Cercophora newfieldiana]|uniref:WSC domain-containing protein n=1 Tax=Cercophora newfieldiana TaxID=92897 RepID=A0AA40CPG0_9PEZI|nr:hypothetical protein B0T16DRAFT_375131 [Cercophora newfieldiana]